MSSVFGGGSSTKASVNASNRAAELSRQQAAAAQRRQLADMARQQAEVDQAKASGGGQRGRRLLTFLAPPTLGGGSDGAGTFGGVS
ncbi:hypothetical protein MKI84_12930 [Ancylobacter sp. A5.8]|uniref:hypothetical protein n=1 Tax=Ancylobacter gelatini TaxID=2919920 RepID=UPI001F4D7028|nr:hypothetical protein [Ancylobacter gelatini]MCJ8143821.1 hypothetical protein [Ancylobacter gelatini]